MGLLTRLTSAIDDRRARRLARLPGPIGDFHRAGGNTLLWRDLPLSTASYLVDGGGFRGEWAREVLWRYGGRCLLFEAVPAFAERLRAEVAGNDRVEIVSAALSGRDGPVAMQEDADSSRMAVPGQPTFTVPGLALPGALSARGVDRVDCLKLNIEGAEFDVLDGLLDEGWLPRVGVLLVQFHRLDAGSEGRREAIRARLAKTHREVFSFPWVWERWDRREP